MGVPSRFQARGYSTAKNSLLLLVFLSRDLYRGFETVSVVYFSPPVLVSVSTLRPYPPLLSLALPLQVLLNMLEDPATLEVWMEAEVRTFFASKARARSSIGLSVPHPRGEFAVVRAYLGPILSVRDRWMDGWLCLGRVAIPLFCPD